VSRLPNNTPDAGSFAELWRVALPLVLSSGSLSLMHVVDRIFLTWFSTDALAAATPAGVLNFMLISFAIGMANYVNTFVAQYEGAGLKHRVSASVWQGLYLSVASGLVMVPFVLLASTIFSAVGHAPGVQKLEVEYFSTLCLGSTPIVAAAVLSCFFSGRGKTLTVMWVNFSCVLVNLVLDYFLIFGSSFNEPMGIRGAAIATVASNALIVCLYCLLIAFHSECREYRFGQFRRFDKELFLRMLRYGMPNGLMYFADVSGFSIFIFLVGMIGPRELAATNLTFNANTLAFVPMMGIGTAVMTLVGKRMGEKRPELAVRTVWTAFALVGCYMLGFAALYVFAPDIILLPYAMFGNVEDFEIIRNHVVVLLRFAAVFGFFDGMVIVFGAAIRGAGDMRFSLVFSTIAAWSLMVMPTFIAWKWYTVSLAISWSGCTAYIVVLGLGFMARFHAGHWMSMRVIEPLDSEVADSEESKPDELVVSGPV